jgi:hypothetical protein
MAWATVRNEGESYLYSYLRSDTGTTGEYPPVLPVFHRYHRSMTGTTGSTDFGEDKFCGKKAYRYYRTFTGTTGQWPVLPVNHRYYR